MTRRAASSRRGTTFATDLFGRQRDLASARELFASSPLVTLTGPGGVGKTSLAAALSSTLERAFRDGAWFVELGAQRNSDTVAEAVVMSLGLSSLPTMGAEEQLRHHVAGRSMLLVLDNCEHVLPGCRRLVSSLLGASPELRVLATSREPLRIRGERVIVVRPLGVPASDREVTVEQLRQYPAVAMLEARAKAVNDEFQITEHDASAVAKLCARLDGMPLAIELAAARLRSLTVHELLARIDDRFALLNRGDPTASPHHHSLAALVRWSYDLCSPDERLLWQRLAAFRGSPDLAAVQAVCGSPPLEGTTLIDAVDQLVSKSILLAEIAGGTMRYRLLETLRAFALEGARDTEDFARARTAHTDHYRALAVQTAHTFFGPGQMDSMRRLELDFPDLELAFDELLTDPRGSRDALQFASSLRFYWMSGHLREGRRWFERALATDTAESAERGNALWAAAWVASLHGDVVKARAYLEESGRTARSLGDRRMAAHTSTWTGLAALISGDSEAALADLEAASNAHSDHPDPEGLLLTWFLLGVVKSALGDHEGATEVARQAVGLSEALDETWGRSYALWVLALDAWTRQDLDAAENLATQSLELKHGFRDDLGAAIDTNLIAGIALDRGDPTKAAKLLGAVAARSVTVGFELRGVLASSYDKITRAAEDRLGPELFRTLYEVGRRLTRAEQMDLALGRTPTGLAQESGTTSAIDVLSAREREVAALLAAGLTNRAIAAKLVLSQRTVEGHVDHILTKLGMRSRTEAGVWAARALHDRA